MKKDIVSNLVIRRYQASDKDEVWELHTLALEKTGAHAGRGPWDEDLANIEEIYLNNNGDFLIGTINNRIVAMGALKKLSKDHVEMKRMRVHPDYQWKGIGTVMLKELEKRAHVLGYKFIQLDTTTKQKAAQQFYLKHGYTEKRREKGKFEIIYYEKHLTP